MLVQQIKGYCSKEWLKFEVLDKILKLFKVLVMFLIKG